MVAGEEEAAEEDVVGVVAAVSMEFAISGEIQDSVGMEATASFTMQDREEDEVVTRRRRQSLGSRDRATKLATLSSICQFYQPENSDQSLPQSLPCGDDAGKSTSLSMAPHDE